MRNSTSSSALSRLLLTLFLGLAILHELSAFTSSCSPTARHQRLGAKLEGPVSNCRAADIRSIVTAPSNPLRAGNTVNGGIDNTSSMERVKKFVDKNFFLLGMAFAVSLGRLFPSVGKSGGLLRPELFIGKFGVTCIFLLSGLSLELSELKAAVSNLKLNVAIQAVTFGAWPFLVGLPLTSLLRTYLPELLPGSLLDGLLILSCLPTTVNMCIILTSASGGNVAASLCNAVFSNLAGIFLTPALLLRFFGSTIQLPFGEMVVKLCNKVLLPVAIGQGLRASRVRNVYEGNSKFFKRLQETILLGIVWNAFCDAFTKGLGLEIHHGAFLLLLLPALHLGSMAVILKIFELPFWKFSRGDVVAAMFCASQKTLAFGLPLVNTIFEGNSNLASYCAPIMFIHPLQLILGSLLVPRLSSYTAGEEKEDSKTNSY